MGNTRPKHTVAHLGKGAHVARQADPVEGREAAVPVGGRDMGQSGMITNQRDKTYLVMKSAMRLRWRGSTAIP
jgi:hypothetical protein